MHPAADSGLTSCVQQAFPGFSRQRVLVHIQQPIAPFTLSYIVLMPNCPSLTLTSPSIPCHYPSPHLCPSSTCNSLPLQTDINTRAIHQWVFSFHHLLFAILPDGQMGFLFESSIHTVY